MKPAMDPEPLRKLLAGGDPEHYVRSIQANSPAVMIEWYRSVGMSEGLINRLIALDRPWPRFKRWLCRLWATLRRSGV
jgi:hypothetical protein